MEAGEALPQDVLIEILINLPVKSLVRFRCVSKYLCSLIRSRNFVSWHLEQDCNECVLLKRVLPGSPQGTTGDGGREILSFHDPDSLDLLVSPDLSLPPTLDHLVDGLFFVGMSTCNGLVCLAICDIFVLCNPALREFEVLPPSPFACPEGYYGSTAAMGFGYDAMADAYKVVNLLEIVDKEKDYPESYEDASFRIDLYNSSTNSWKLIDAMVPKVINNSQFELFFNGACHWQHEFGDILSFDLSTEVFRHFEYPDFGDEKFAQLVVLNQCLSLVRVGGWGDGSQRWAVDPQLWADDPDFVEIWVMKEYGVKESWTKEFIIGPYAFNNPILLLKNEWLLVKTYDSQLASCALHGNEMKKFHFYDEDDSMRAVILKESLISLKQVIFRPKED